MPPGVTFDHSRRIGPFSPLGLKSESVVSALTAVLLREQLLVPLTEVGGHGA